MWRTGRKVGRTIYRQLGPEATDDDELIGVMDEPALAAAAVRAVNDEQRLHAALHAVWDEFHEIMHDDLHAQVRDALGLRTFEAGR